MYTTLPNMGETSYQLVQDVFHQPYVSSQEGIWYDFYTVETRNFDSKETVQLHPRNMDPSIPLTIVLLPVVDWVSWSSPSWCDISPSNQQKVNSWIDIIHYIIPTYILDINIYIFTCNHLVDLLFCTYTFCYCMPFSCRPILVPLVLRWIHEFQTSEGSYWDSKPST